MMYTILQTVRRAMSRVHGANTVERASDESDRRRLPRALLRLCRVWSTATQRRPVRRQRLANLLSSRLREEVCCRRFSPAQSKVRRLVPF